MTKDLREYEKNWPGLPIKYLVLSTEEFIVFLDDVYDLDWKTTVDFENRELSVEDKKNFNSVCNEIAYLESIPLDDLKEKTIINYKRQIGEALVRNFRNDYYNAHKMLELAKDYIIDRNADKSRFLYLKASGLITLIAISFGSLSWLFRDLIINIIGITAFYLWLSFLIGSLGAYLSITLRMGKTNLDYHATKKLHYMEGTTKVFAGMISGLLVALCIKAGILLPVFEKVGSTHLAMVIGGLIAGASERLAPSLIRKIEGNKSNKS